jgi:hypothetical protein
MKISGIGKRRHGVAGRRKHQWRGGIEMKMSAMASIKIMAYGGVASASRRQRGISGVIMARRVWRIKHGVGSASGNGCGKHRSAS